MNKKDIDRVENELCDNFKNAKGFIEINGHVFNEDGDGNRTFSLEIYDGLGHTWYWDEYNLNDYETLSELGHKVSWDINEWSIDEEFKEIIRGDAPGTPDIPTLMNIYDTVYDTCVNYLNYLSERNVNVWQKE